MLDLACFVISFLFVLSCDLFEFIVTPIKAIVIDWKPTETWGIRRRLDERLSTYFPEPEDPTEL